MNCSFNNMTKLPDQVLPRTELLIMTGNNLEHLDSVPGNFPQMMELDLNDSNIKTIDDKVLEMLLMKTEKLYLSNNVFKAIPSLIQVEKTHTELWLLDNPFDCNCDMMWMRDWLLNTTNVVEKDKIVCASGKWKGVCDMCK